MITSQVTVAICTHNPNDFLFRRVLDSLKNQTLAKQQWELLIVDNCSNEPIQSYVDISWHPYARVVRENKLGLTYARLRSIREAMSSLLVFVDDDNFLQNNFLEEALAFISHHPRIGAFGPRIDGEFEIPVPPWLKPWTPFLAINSNWGDIVKTTTDPKTSRAIPCGAGLCILKDIALKYADQVNRDKNRILLDRRGTNLYSSGDTDLVFTTIDLGYEVGYNPKMRLIHYMPKTRLCLSYIARLRRSGSISAYVVRYIHGIWPATKKPSLISALLTFVIKNKINGEWRGYWIKLNECVGRTIGERYCYQHHLSVLKTANRCGTPTCTGGIRPCASWGKRIFERLRLGFET